MTAKAARTDCDRTLAEARKAAVHVVEMAREEAARIKREALNEVEAARVAANASQSENVAGRTSTSTQGEAEEDAKMTAKAARTDCDRTLAEARKAAVNMVEMAREAARIKREALSEVEAAKVSANASQSENVAGYRPLEGNVGAGAGAVGSLPNFEHLEKGAKPNPKAVASDLRISAPLKGRIRRSQKRNRNAFEKLSVLEKDKMMMVQARSTPPFKFLPGLYGEATARSMIRSFNLEKNRRRRFDAMSDFDFQTLMLVQKSEDPEFRDLSTWFGTSLKREMIAQFNTIVRSMNVGDFEQM